MTFDTASFLLSDDGAALLTEAETIPPARRPLTLRERGHSTERIAGALAVLDGRERARKRGFKGAERLFVTPDALAQATSPSIARFHAAQLASCGRVADIACGLGFDALAFAEAGIQVLAVERDPARLLFARANAKVRGVAEQVTFVEGQAEETDLTGWPAVYFDPARRIDSRRHSALAKLYEPPLGLMERWRTAGKTVLAKLSPALPDELLNSLGSSLLFLSENRECKEACVSVGLGERVGAMLLPEEIFVPTGELPTVAESLGAFLLDPDPALVRAGALAGVGAERISPDDAYLTSDEATANLRLARSYRVIEAMEYQPKKLGAWLRERGIGPLVVKKRRFPKEPDTVMRELDLQKEQGEEATLVLVASGRGHLAIVCEPT